MFSFWRRARAPRRIYLDHAASTPTHPYVVQAMLPYLTSQWGNPSAIHAEGRAARSAIETARQEVATILGVRPAGVTFTSGGTEGNVLGIIGYLVALHEAGRPYEEMVVLTTATQHPSISETLTALKDRGVRTVVVPVDAEGFVTEAALRAALSAETVLVALAYANSEVGTVERVHTLARVLRAYERSYLVPRIALLVDAAQAPLWLPCDLPRLGADLLTLDGAKCGGPKGSGILALRKGIEVSAVLFGGGQEQGRRPGTENVAGIVGLATALRLAQAGYEKRARTVATVRDAGIAVLKSALPTLVLNGPVCEGRIANNINISLSGLDTEYAVVVLDTAGIATSTKSACASADGGESAVVMAMSGDIVRSRSTLRLSLGEETTVADIERVGSVLADLVLRMKRLTR